MLVDLKAIASFVSGLSLTLLGAPASPQSPDAVTADEGCLSCSPCAVDSCQTNLPGGLILLTQFWDSHPAAGPDDSWTIHGLWPDYCNGSYPQNCDASRASLQPLQVLKDAGETDLISFMNEFWISNMGSTPAFWQHEWSKHGVCVSTLAPKCYPEDESDPERGLVDFFKTTTSLFQRYNIYDALAKADITPSRERWYRLADLKAALQDAFGVTVALRCQSVYLQEAWVYHHTRGRATDPDSFVAIDALSKDDRCPQSLRYMPK
ncbi:Ribonuclease T2-like [Tilletia horrida]|nr:Ribonuclease T2-like [Tilletia horrida]